MVELNLDPGETIYEGILMSNKLAPELESIKEACKDKKKRYRTLWLEGVRVKKDVLYKDRRLWVPEDCQLTLLNTIYC